MSLEAECVTALWQLFVSGRFTANWCKRLRQGPFRESTYSRGVGSTPQTLLGLCFDLFYAGMQTEPFCNLKAQSCLCVFVCVCASLTVKAELCSAEQTFSFCKKVLPAHCWMKTELSKFMFIHLINRVVFCYLALETLLHV